MDFVVRAARLPAPGETVLGEGYQMIPGGKGANQAVAAARIGAASVTVKMIGRVGMDVFGDRLRASLAGAGVDISAVHASKSQPTGAALIAVDGAGQNQIVVASGANGELAAGEAEAMRRVFRGAQIALFQLETPLATVAAALKIAKEEGLTTILDPAPAQALPPGMIADIDIVTPNETESWAAEGCPTVVLKMGADGCSFRGAGEEYAVPAFPVHAVDTTAAGDTFNAALGVGLAEGRCMRDALRFANAAAAVSVTKPGAQTSAPTRAEVDALLRD
jgi:ribokinase